MENEILKFLKSELFHYEDVLSRLESESKKINVRIFYIKTIISKLKIDIKNLGGYNVK